MAAGSLKYHVSFVSNTVSAIKVASRLDMLSIDLLSGMPDHFSITKGEKIYVFLQ